tara:strand:+ start:1193 stop:1648 length:456 start_codon:yes stop_codon:yes gene_type:complete
MHVHSNMLAAKNLVRIAVLLATVLTVGACGGTSNRRVVAMPPSALETETGSVNLVFSRETSGVIVSIDGQLVVERATLKHLHIADVPTGYVELAIAADGVERQMRIWVDSEKTTSLPIGAAPMPPASNPILTAGLSILALLVSRSVSNWLF